MIYDNKPEYNLERFINAQRLSFDCAFAEISAGRKRTHWMWYIFPQLRDLGISRKALYYGIADIGEAKAYMAEPYLRNNLISITKVLLMLEETDPRAVVPPPDNIKLCSCMTLFEAAAPDVPEFGMVLEKFYCGRRDIKTLELLGK